jgi:hypothetical protein
VLTPRLPAGSEIVFDKLASIDAPSGKALGRRTSR